MSPSAGNHGVVVAVDGSPSSKAATDWAAREALSRAVPLTIVHAFQQPTIGFWPEPLMFQDFWDYKDKYGAKLLGLAEQTAREATAGSGPLSIETKFFTGPPIPTLTDLSKDATMMVVGRRGLGRLQRQLLGSVSLGLVHHSHCPVAVIHDEDPLMDNPATAPVLLGVDGSPASELATAIAFDEASRRGVRLVALHAWLDDNFQSWLALDWKTQRDDGERALAEQLAGWQERYPDVAVERRLVYEDAAHHLVAASESAQLTVLGSHGRGGFAGMLLGSVSSAVVQAVRMPVIVARQG